MKFKNFKKGFSLVELMIFFLFVTILIAASTPVITKRIKNVPLRAYHGKFLCYRDVQKDDDGNIIGSKLIGEYYNSTGKLTKRVESDNETTLPFVPPKRAAIYKIDMIGAGAGGYNYVDYANEADPDHRSYFNRYGEGEFSGDSVYKLKDEDIKERFQDVLNTIVAYTGSGGNSGSINYSHAIPEYATSNRADKCTVKNKKRHCYYYDVKDWDPATMTREWNEPGENNINTLEVIKPKVTQFESWLSATYPNKTESAVEVKCDNEHKCKTQVREYTRTKDILDSIQSKLDSLGLGRLLPITVSNPKYINGGSGGSGKYISYTYKIDFNNPEAQGMSAAEYVKLLMEQYVSGWSEQRADKAGFKFLSGSVTSGSSSSSVIAAITDNKRSAETDAGEDANGYAAIRVGKDYYITNFQKPTGAGKTVLKVNNSTGRFNLSLSDGIDADGLIDSNGIQLSGNTGIDGTGASIDSDASRDIKYIELISTVPTRTYYIGGKGDSAKPVTRTFTTLSKECTITIPPLSQSDPIEEDTVIGTPMNTEFVCQGWKQPLIAISATPTKECKTRDGSRAACNSTTVSFPIFDPYRSVNYGDFDDLGFIVLPDFYEIAAQVAEKSQFGVISRIFTKGPNLTNYGSGGDGTYYKDECLEMGGKIVIRTKNSNGTVVSTSTDIRFPYDPSCKMSDNERKPATAGGQGAVIISW